MGQWPRACRAPPARQPAPQPAAPLARDPRGAGAGGRGARQRAAAGDVSTRHFHHKGGQAATSAMNTILDPGWELWKPTESKPWLMHTVSEEPGVQAGGRGLHGQPRAVVNAWAAAAQHLPVVLFSRGPHPAEHGARKTLGLSQCAPSVIWQEAGGSVGTSVTPVPILTHHMGSLLPGAVGAVGRRRVPAAAMPLPRAHGGGRAQGGCLGHHPGKGKSCARSTGPRALGAQAPWGAPCSSTGVTRVPVPKAAAGRSRILWADGKTPPGPDPTLS